MYLYSVLHNYLYNMYNTPNSQSFYPLYNNLPPLKINKLIVQNTLYQKQKMKEKNNKNKKSQQKSPMLAKVFKISQEAISKP